ncbi:MAG: Flagellum site-determining protein YlxH [Planctomycetota bacterium]|jgi:flagellar biosynthesis protein FlhG
MTDQAAELRKLVLAEARTAAGNFEHRPRLLVITGAKGGVGATTTAVNLAVALADHGARVVLVDADPNRAGVASLCGLDEQHGLADVLAARRDIHEVLVRGPAGIQVAPGVWAPDSRVVRATGPMPIDTGSGTVNDLFSERAAARLLRQLSGLGRHAEWAVLDVGQGPSVLLRRLWLAADVAVMVTTPDSLAVMDAYAGLKRLKDGQLRAMPCLLVNHTQNREEALDAHSRVEQACRRFLSCELRFAGHVPVDAMVAAAAEQRKPVVAWAAKSAAATALSQIAAALLAETPSGSAGSSLGDSNSGSWRGRPIVA